MSGYCRVHEDDRLWAIFEWVKRPSSERGEVITKEEAEKLYDYYDDCYEDWDFDSLIGTSPREFSREVQALAELMKLPRPQNLGQRIFGKWLAPFPNGQDSFSIIHDLIDTLAERIDDSSGITEEKYKAYGQTLDQVHEELFHEFHAADLGTLSEGECYYKLGEDDMPSAVGAPHEGFDLFTSRIARGFAEMHPTTAVVYCEGFRKGKRYDVNRASGEEGETRTARKVMEKYERHIKQAYGGIPKIFHEIHGKGDKQHPFTEITFIGDDQRCGWSQGVRQQAKQMWETGLHEKVVVYDLDPEAYYGHTEYQASGLAAIHSWCGVNVELSKTARDLWNSKNLANLELSVQRAYILNGLSGLFAFAEAVVENSHRVPGTIW